MHVHIAVSYFVYASATYYSIIVRGEVALSKSVAAMAAMLPTPLHCEKGYTWFGAKDASERYAI